ncbi:chemotaxis protein CheW [candidate division WOR-3 bacterium]|nr:chemotaxis protein CheW [candidate division WOR-3 bacterium]
MAGKRSTHKKTLPGKVKKTAHIKASSYTRADPGKSSEVKIAVFQVGIEMYAFPMESIMETLYSFTVTHVEHLPEVFTGIMNLRGRSLPVVSLHTLLNVEECKDPTPVCVIVKMNGDHMGFLVDSDIEIIPEHMGSRHALPDCFTAEEGEFLEGIFWFEQRFVGILNPRRMMEMLAGWRSGDEKK